ncbi:MAG: hypothetical protein QG623_369 [Patescibacteria group bacterium]|nr:hypothetical protein [Patescibacteria group bacterium]
MERQIAYQQLEKRFEETTLLLEKGIYKVDDVVNCFNAIGHYMTFVNTLRPCKKAAKKLRNKNESVKISSELKKTRQKLITQLKKDTLRIREIADNNKLVYKKMTDSPVDMGHNPKRMTTSYLILLEEYLEKDDEDYQELIGKLGQARWLLRIMEEKELLAKKKGLWGSEEYDKAQSKYGKAVRRNKAFKEYSKIDDYSDLEAIRRHTYQEVSDDELHQFYMIHFELFYMDDVSRDVEGREKHLVDESMAEVRISLERIHNLFSIAIIDIPFYSRMFGWTIEHLLPTFLSVAILAAIALAITAIFDIPIENVLKFF